MYGHFILVQKTEPAETAGSDIFVMYRLTVLPQIAAEELIIIQRIDAIRKTGLFRGLDYSQNVSKNQNAVSSTKINRKARIPPN